MRQSYMMNWDIVRQSKNLPKVMTEGILEIITLKLWTAKNLVLGKHSLLYSGLNLIND